MNILYVSRYAVYNGVPHAGGNTVLYYMSNMAKDIKNDVRIVSFVENEEKERIDLSKYNIQYYSIPWKKNILGMLKSVNSKINPFHKFCNMIASYHIEELLNYLENIKREFYPDIVVVEWTQFILAIKNIKKVFPSAKFIASEHDVTFLGAYRKFLNEKNIFIRWYKYLVYKNIKNREVNALYLFDKVVVHNQKDESLLIENGFPKENISKIVAYYHRTQRKYHRENNGIIFYGALSRRENIESVEWFIKKVLPKLNDMDIQFYVVGGGLTEDLRKYQSSKVIFTGYVDKIDDIFSNAMCFVAPMVLGAGIKVKVLEAMYTGITVITNEVGIEGIPAQKNKDYYHCEKAEEYAKIIKMLYNNSIPMLNANNFIIREFDIETSFFNYENTMRSLCEKNNI